MDWRFCLLKLLLLDASFVSKMVKSGAAEGAFENYWERFAAHLEQLERSPLTIKNYRSDLKAFVKWLDQPGQALPSLTKVSSKEMKQYQEFLLTQQKLNPGSVNRRLGALKNFYTWLQQTEGLTHDRLLHMPNPVKRVSVARVAPLSQVERQNLLDAVQQSQNLRDYVMLNILLSTGVRVGELCQLRWADLEISAGQGQLLVRSGKSRRDRRLVLPPETCAALLDLGYLAQAGTQAPVFVGQRGGMTPRGVQDIVKKYAKRAGLEKLTPHMLRHTYVAMLMEKGVSPREIAILTGASAEMLLDYYESPLLVEKGSMSFFFREIQEPVNPCQ